MDQVTTDDGAENVQILPATDDEFGGVVVEMKEHMDTDVFQTLLRISMSQWKLQGKKGVWIKLPIDLSNLVDTAVKEGFWYHHAEPKYLMLLYWIPKTINPIPANASHIARVGAIVLNDKREMLVVQEKMGVLRGLWKISTGIIHEGEDITIGVVREVKEETGIDTEFVEVLAFSQEHKVFFGKSELLFLCMMRPLSFDIQIQETEIEAAQWMPLEEYATQLSAQEQGLRKYITELCIANVERSCSGFSPLPSDGVDLPIIHCEYPSCQPTPSRPLYGTPPPPSPPIEPVCPPPPQQTPPPSEPVYEAPPSPNCPSCEPPAPPLPTGPQYGAPPPPLMGICQPAMQNCAYPPPTTNVYQPLDSASLLPRNCLHILVLIFILFLQF